MNDANCFTLSEAVDGAKDYKSIFGIIIGTGFGIILQLLKKQIRIGTSTILIQLKTNKTNKIR